MEQVLLPVEEFTTPNPITASEGTSIAEISQIMADNGIRHLPITRGNQIVGIVSDRDIRVLSCLNLHEQLHITASSIMATEPVTVSSESSLDQVAFIMSEKKIGSVLVNEGDTFLGIFTVTDALNALIEINRSIRENLKKSSH